MYNIMDLFAGVGGLSYGFSHIDDFHIVVANEIHPDIAEAYSLNHPDVNMINCDINDLTEDVLKSALNGQKVDIVVGGPPCQSYSTIGRRRMDDRANLFLQYKRILTILEPRMFVFENVTGILTMDHHRLFENVRREFEELGYELRHQVLDAADYGVPQHRKRVILVGTKDGIEFEYPEPTHGDEGSGLLPWVTFGEATGDLPSIESGGEATEYASEPSNEFQRFAREGCGDALTEHRSHLSNERALLIMRTLKDGQTRDDLPDDIRPTSGYGNTYAKLWWDRPSTTITRNFACPSSSRCIHPRDSRALSIREGARLQSFPDSHRFHGSDGTRRLEIGNAVPPLLSVAIAGKVREALEAADAR